MQNLRQKAYNLLRWSERYTQTDMIYLAKGGFWLTFGQTITVVASFAVSVAFANLFPAYTYGSYQFILSVIGILSVFSLSGLNTSAIRAVAKKFEGVILPMFKTKLHWSTYGSIAAAAVGFYYIYNGNNSFGISFLLAAAFLPFFYSLGISSSLLKGKRLFYEDAKYGTISQISVSAAIISVLFLTDNLVVVIATYFIGWCLARIIVFRKTLERFKENDEVDDLSEKYGKHLSVMGVINTVADNLDKILIFQMLGPIQVAIYSFAIAPVMQLKGVMKNIHVLALPKLSQRPDLEIRKSVLKRSMLMLALSIPVATIYALAAPYLFNIFFPAYQESILVSQFFSTSIIFAAMGLIPATTLEARMEVRKKYTLTVFSKVSKIVLMIGFTMLYGLYGLIAGLLINHFIVAVFAIYLARKE